MLYLAEVFPDNSAKTLNFYTNTFEILLKKSEKLYKLKKNILMFLERFAQVLDIIQAFAVLAAFL